MRLTFFYLYYNNPAAIDNLIRQGIPEMDVDVLIVDDGSTVPLVLDWPNVRVVRIEEDIPWNMAAANNLGFRQLDPDQVILRMDIDHWVDFTHLQKIKDFAEMLFPGDFLRFDRLVFCGRGFYITPPHANTYLCRVSDLLEVGGYDERFCGHYGHEDNELMWRLSQKGKKLIHIRQTLIHCDESLRTPGMERDSIRNLSLFNQIKLSK